jgi:7,8-dihydropterin-6-yl-methyl-4-(beta-D-ribofuranosyl)aminobenzene 5'-phosphate synthase
MVLTSGVEVVEPKGERKMSMSQTVFPSFVMAALVGAVFATPAAQAKTHGADPNTPVVDNYKITVLSDAIPGRTTIGEWGYSALVEVTSGGVTKRFLFDASDKPGTVSFNAAKLGISDFCSIEEVVLSHNHADHTNGLAKLRTDCLATNGNAFKTAYYGGPEIFWSRYDSAKPTVEKNPMLLSVKAGYESTGGAFTLAPQSTQFLLPGVFLTGRIQRTHDEGTYIGTPRLMMVDPQNGPTDDLVPEDQALVINASNGTLVLTGCAHAGTINTLEQAKRIVGGEPNFILAGGLHWFQMEKGDKSTVGTVDWEAESMKNLDVIGMLGGHCTGFERFFYIRDYLKLDWSQASMSAVGTVLAINPLFTFTLPQAFNIPMGSPKN